MMKGQQMLDPKTPLTKEQRAQYLPYAAAIGADGEISDERLISIINSIAQECAQWGCD